MLAIENFERVANTLATELGARASTQDADTSSAAASGNLVYFTRGISNIGIT